VILDDGDDPVADLVPDDPTIRYVRADHRMLLGAKCNELVRLAHGDLLHFWNDDDWQAPRALRVLAEAQAQTGAALVGTSEMLFHEVEIGGTWVWHYPLGPKYLIGGSLLWTRETWTARSFDDDLARVVDGDFILGRHPDEKTAFLNDWTWYVATIHDSHTSPRLARDGRSPHWRRWDGDLRAVLGECPQPWWMTTASKSQPA